MTDINPIDSRHSRPLDVHLWSEHAEVDNLVDFIFNTFTEVERQSIKGKSNNKGKASGITLLKLILIDLYVAWKTDPELSIGVARGNGAYKVNSRYNALFISSRIREVIDLLISRDYLDSIGGSHDRVGKGQGSHTSRIRASSKLREAFKKLTIEPYHLNLNHNQECIILSDYDTDDEGNFVRMVKGNSTVKKRIFVEYKDTDNPNLVSRRSDLQKYNKLLKQTYVDIPALEEPFITRQLKNGNTQRVQINQTGKFVRRIFSRGSWEMNGRFYGGFWQQISKDLRKKIYINDNPTVEVDYKGLHAAILSARQGVFDSSDRYDLGRQILPDFDLKQQRNMVKLLVLTAINAKSPKSAFSAFRHSQPKGSMEKKLKDNQLQQLLDTFINTHPYLEEDMCSDKGIELMFTDSQITAHIINKFTELNKPILSVHDSYIVCTKDTELLRETMQQATLNIVGTDLSAEQQIPSYQQIEAMRYIDRDRYIDTFNTVLVNKFKSKQYQQRLSDFWNYHDSKTQQ